MHCYEVIPEGAVCKLYFDLEFYKPANKGADGKIMVSRLIRVCCSIFYFLICYCQSRLLHIQQLLQTFYLVIFFKSLKPQLNLFWAFAVCLWQADGSLWNHIYHLQRPEPWLQYRGEVQSASHLQSQKCRFQRQHTCGYVPCLSKGNFWWHVVLKSYSLCCLGRFIHAILQPILSTLKGGRSHNSGVNNSEMRFGFQISPLNHCFFAINTWGLLFLISDLTAEHLTFLEANHRSHQRVVGVHRPRGTNRTSETCGSSWWRTRTARTVCLLISVRETQKWFALLCWFSQHVIYKNRSLHQEQKFPAVQVVEGWEEDPIHRGRGQHVSRRTREK